MTTPSVYIFRELFRLTQDIVTAVTRVFQGGGSTFLALSFRRPKATLANIMSNLGLWPQITLGSHNGNLNILLEVFIFSVGPYQYKNRGRYCPTLLPEKLVGL